MSAYRARRLPAAAAMIREHPRFRRPRSSSISAIHLTDVDRLRAEMGRSTTCRCRSSPVLRAKVGSSPGSIARPGSSTASTRLEHRVVEHTAERRESAAPADAQRGAQPGAGRRPDGIVGGIRSTATSWDDRTYRIFGVDPGQLRGDRRQYQGADPSEDWKHLQNAITPATRRARPASRPSSACAVRTGSCAGASARRWRASTRPTMSCASAA